MRLAFALAPTLLCAGALAQTPAGHPPPKVERLCGKLQRVQTIPVKDSPLNLVEKTTDISGAAISLYPTDGKTECCNALSAIARSTTGRWGGFHLNDKRLPGGFYWLVAEVAGQKYKLLIQYVSQRNSSQLCSDTYWQLNENGEFWKTETIFVE